MLSLVKATLGKIAAETLAWHGADPNEPFHVIIEDLRIKTHVEHVFDLDDIASLKALEVVEMNEALPPTPNGKTPRRPKLLFSPIEQFIMKAVTSEWQTKHEIAAKCNLAANSQFCTLLTNLVERGYLDSGHHGYRLLSDQE